MTKLHSKPAFVTLITDSVRENLDLSQLALSVARTSRIFLHNFAANSY